MVYFQGVSVNLVSETNGKPLIEYPFPGGQSEDGKNVISTYVLYARGSRFWIEYEVHDPLPPNAKFFFVLYHDDQRIASWDCVGENGYKGKAQFGIHHAYEGEDPSNARLVFQRRLFTFPMHHYDYQHSMKDCFRVEIYRMQARKRLANQLIPYFDNNQAGIDKSNAYNFV